MEKILINCLEKKFKTLKVPLRSSQEFPLGAFLPTLGSFRLGSLTDESTTHERSLGASLSKTNAARENSVGKGRLKVSSEVATFSAAVSPFWNTNEQNLCSKVICFTASFVIKVSSSRWSLLVLWLEARVDMIFIWKSCLHIATLTLQFLLLFKGLSNRLGPSSLPIWMCFKFWSATWLESEEEQALLKQSFQETLWISIRTYSKRRGRQIKSQFHLWITRWHDPFSSHCLHTFPLFLLGNRVIQNGKFLKVFCATFKVRFMGDFV